MPDLRSKLKIYMGLWVWDSRKSWRARKHCFWKWTLCVDPKTPKIGVVEKCYAFEQIVTPKEMGQSVQADSELLLQKRSNKNQLNASRLLKGLGLLMTKKGPWPPHCHQKNTKSYDLGFGEVILMTLRQTCSWEYHGRHLRSKIRWFTILQFTLRIAACCVLHRCTSQEIHRYKLSIGFVFVFFWFPEENQEISWAHPFEGPAGLKRVWYFLKDFNPRL